MPTATETPPTWENSHNERKYDPQLSEDVTKNADNPEERIQELFEARDRIHEKACQEVYDYIAGMGIDINLQTIKRRLANTTLVLTDFKSQFDLEDDLHAGYMRYLPQAGMIIIPAYPPNKGGPEGRLENIDPASPDFDREAFRGTIHEYFHASSFSGNGSHHFPMWLMEAMTEDLSNAWYGNLPEDEIDKKTSFSYRRMQDLKGEIIEITGVPEELFLEAYFEDPLSMPLGQPSKWHKLQSKLDEKLGPNFLKRATRKKMWEDGIWNNKDFREELRKMHDKRTSAGRLALMSYGVRKRLNPSRGFNRTYLKSPRGK